MAAALFVTAHPDDETMFFSPSILNLVDRGMQVALLCLSTGDADGLGRLRSQELRHACSLLGIAGQDITLIDDPQLPDGMDQHWSPLVVEQHVAQAVRRLQPDQIYTFDNGGVSGHPNHLATCAGVLRWWEATPSSSSPSSMPELWQLETVSLPRKYLGLLDSPLAHLMAAMQRRRRQRQQRRQQQQRQQDLDSVQVVVRASPRQAWRALLKHRSQMVWYRRVWMVLSRYMYVNTLVRHY
ncbi:hypothetical protein D9Q98_009637 [Chlorella vulgaris]|uniref:N-acetylglucosaminylphosphatidylinositol deacetylase n=1 Tax=Chlorella vulgaris TaxID=3077 RepID=A0A9D4YSB6_CHLVU|nr:hypothetical protein D9Q98_009637 [Chlorella vulgaris]